jgi:hypothetical protein
MKKVFFVFLVMFFVGVNSYTQTIDRDFQWDFFKNVIPKHNSIKITGNISSSGTWQMTIDDKYRVSFSGNYGSSWEPEWRENDRRGRRYQSSSRTNATFNGTGVIVWDNEKMKMELAINGSGSYESVYSNLDRPYENGGSKISEDRYSTSGSQGASLTFDILPEYTNGSFTGRLRLPTARTFTLAMTGNTSSSVNLTIGGNNWYTATLALKSESELNASSKDEFGEWNWNSDRTRLFLKSQSSDNKFVILNINGNITWCMEMINGIKGSSESETDSGDKLVNLAMAFDGAPAQNFTFIENTERLSDTNFVQLDYAVYNRFLGSLDKNSETILNQIREKQMLILTYTVNNTQRTDMFLLDGLATILDYLKK